MITRDRLHELLIYNKGTGLWTRRVGVRGYVAGSKVGSVRHDGRTIICVDGKKYLASRLAFMYVLGRWPDPEADHRDKDRSNDRWSNLRDATHSQNNCNTTLRSDNTTGARGVRRMRNGWQVRVHTNGQCHYLGTYKSIEVAARVAAKARAKMHGDFSA